MSYNGNVSYNESPSAGQVLGSTVIMGTGLGAGMGLAKATSSLVSTWIKGAPAPEQISNLDLVAGQCAKVVPVVTVAVAGVTLATAAGKAVSAGWECTKTAGVWAFDTATGCFKKMTSWFIKKPSNAFSTPAPVAQTTTAPAAQTTIAPAAQTTTAPVAPAAQTTTAPAAPAAQTTPAPAAQTTTAPVAPAEKN